MTPAVLCVDDEPNVLEALGRTLRRQFTVFTAPGGAAALEILESRGPFPVVLSDMRMPGMDGATFLANVRERAPDTVRVLLTGHADLDAAVKAVNEAGIFRFLCKPCAPELLVKVLRDAVEQHRLVTAERVLLQQTLQGSIKMLTDLLALASPLAFGRATRVKQLVSRILAHLGIADGWAIEIAAMLSQVGCVTLPASTAEKLYHGRTLAPDERTMVARLPALAAELVGNIPRLEPVRHILASQDECFDRSASGDHPLGGRLLKLVLDWDALEAQGLPREMALQRLHDRDAAYDPDLLRVLGDVVRTTPETVHARELSLRDVQPGMIFASDVTTRAGVLLIARGQEVTESLVERIRNFSGALGVREPVRVVVSPAAPPRPGPSHAASHPAAD